MKRIALLIFSLVAVLTAQAGTIDINGTLYQSDTLECYQVGPGTMYTRFVVTIGNTAHNMYMLTADLTNPYLKVEEYQGQDEVGKQETLLSAHSKIDSVGHRPIGSVNCNFWCVSGNISGPSSAYAGLLGVPFSGTAKDGVLIGNPSDWNNQGDRGYLMIDELNRAIIRNMKWSGRVSKGADTGRAIRDCNRNRNNPNASEIALYNRYIGTTRAIADTVLELIFEPLEGQEWTINDTMQCRVISRNNHGQTRLTGKQGALQGRGARGTWMSNNLQVGDTFQIKLGMYSFSETGDDNYSGDSIAPRILQMVTGNCLVMADGQLTSRNWNENYNNQNYPRTLLATNNDGTRLWMLVSQNPGNYTHEMCCIVRHDGATWAAGMDGGGSAQIDVLGQYPFISKDGTPRAVANSLFLVSTAPDDNNVSSLQFVDNLPSTVSSYSSYTPAMRAYNQYGVLLSGDFADYTLSCSPAGLGTISADGRTFIAGSTAGSGTLTATFGGVSVEKQITVEEGIVSLALDSVWIDTRDYRILAYSTSGGKQLEVDPAYFSWTVDDNAVCEVTEEGVLRGLRSGETDIHGQLGSSSASMHVTVEIADAPSLMQTRFLEADTAAWTLKNSANPIWWGMTADSTACLKFSVTSARSPQVSLNGNLKLYSLPDSVELLIESPVKVKSVGLIGYARNSSAQKSAALTPEMQINTPTSYMASMAKFDLDTTDISIWPFRLTKIVLTLTDVTVKVPYEVKLLGLRLHYGRYTVISSLDELTADEKAVKIIENGQVIIIRQGRRYDLLGREMR